MPWVIVWVTGSSKPLVTGTDPESRQRNRRVEIAVVQSAIDYLSEAEAARSRRRAEQQN